MVLDRHHTRNKGHNNRSESSPVGLRVSTRNIPPMEHPQNILRKRSGTHYVSYSTNQSIAADLKYFTHLVFIYFIHADIINICQFYPQLY